LLIILDPSCASSEKTEPVEPNGTLARCRSIFQRGTNSLDLPG
jgi:hypothetical protein